MKDKSFIQVFIVTFALAFFCLFLYIACQEEYQYTHGKIKGTVMDATTGRPVNLACNISIINIEGNVVTKLTTDSIGEYKTKDLSAGNYTITVEQEVYATSSKNVQVKSEEITQCDFTLNRLPAEITTNTEELDFGSDASNTSYSFSIVNNFLPDLEWYIGDYDCKWISSINPNKGILPHGQTVTIIVMIDRSKLQGGENKTNIVVTSKNGQGKNISIKATGEHKEAPVLNVGDVLEIDKTSAVLTGKIEKEGIPVYSSRGFTCSLTSMDETATELFAEVNNNAEFSFKATGLTPGKQYYVRAFAVNESAGKVWSANETSFITTESYPSVRTVEVSEINLINGSCILNGFIEQSGNPTYDEKGFCISNSGEPTINDTKYTINGNATGSFSATMSGLVSENIYRVRAYVIQRGKVFYGSTVSFSTSTTATSVATTGASSVSHNSAVLNGTILNDGNPKYSERGFCYSTSNKTPTITDSKIPVVSVSSNDFSYHMSNLESNKTYWFRAYAIQNSQPVYGDVASFETTWSETTILTKAADNIKYYEMNLNGHINNVGIPSYSQKGFCYSILEEEPDLTNSTKLTVSGTAEGAFYYHLTNLLAHTRYYYRAFAIQDGKTIYGDVMSASTYSPPQVITSDAYPTPDVGMMNMSWTVELTGVYGYKGDPECNDFGFVYGPGDNPTAENTSGYTVVQATKIEPFANSQGSFSVVLKEMVGYTKYYYRAYAKTSLGYTYGEVMAFSTQP